MTLVLSEKISKFLQHFEAPKNDVQLGAYNTLQTLNFPTTRDEYWKYTRVGKIANAALKQATPQNGNLALDEYIMSPTYIVVENGNIRTDLSKFDATEFDVSFYSGNEIEHVVANSRINQQDIFNVSNTALTQTAIGIEVADKQTIATPLQLIFVDNGDHTAAFNRLMMKAGKFSKASVVLTYVNSDDETTFTNCVTEIDVAENAHFTVSKIQAGNAKNLAVCTEQVKQADDSTFKINTITLNGLLQRNNINIEVAGQNCETHMNGAVVTSGNQHVDNHTFVDHQVPNCFSNENYKYVLDGRSTGVFNGKVIVQKDAQVINAYQNNGNILLSDEAQINSKPELEIYADDVKCSHGSTTGQLDEDALFYLETRGISKANGRKLLVSAFIGEVIESIEDEAVTDLIYALLKKEHGWDF